MTLDVGSQRLDGWTSSCDIIDCDGPSTRERDEIESIAGEGEKRVQQLDLPGGVVPYRPETRHRMSLHVPRRVEQDRYCELEGGRVNSRSLRFIQGADNRRPV